MERPVVVIPAYSRANSLRRLLDSINNAFYCDQSVHVIVSLDGGASRDVIDIAKSFEFFHGTFEFIYRDENIGLRNHILWCGDLSLKYGSVIILEDDLEVDVHFYIYAQKALDFYRDEENVCGVSLYSPRYNEYVGLPFEPLSDRSSSYFMMVPCSWGQAWDMRQWTDFRNWLESEEVNKSLVSEKIPVKARKWSSKSWKKYFYAFMVEKNKFFSYPYSSYTTNHADVGGTHVASKSSLFQVPLGSPKRCLEVFKFAKFRDSQIKYDSFMESLVPFAISSLDLQSEDIEIDFYAQKEYNLIKKKRYYLTSRRGLGKALMEFGLELKPVELNWIKENCESSQKHLFLYKTDFDKLPTQTESAIHRRKWAQVEFLSYVKFGLKMLIIGSFKLMLRKVGGRFYER